jgi:hypothetical protein
MLGRTGQVGITGQLHEKRKAWGKMLLQIYFCRLVSFRFKMFHTLIGMVVLADLILFR